MSTGTFRDVPMSRPVSQARGSRSRREAGAAQRARLGGALCCLLAVGIVGCSDDSGVRQGTVVPVTTPAATVNDVQVVTAPPEPEASEVAVSATLRGETSNHALAIEDGTISDPFGKYATCSGSWGHFGAYNILVSSPDPEIGSVQINTVAHVRADGPIGATARIERGEDLVTSSGILEVDEGFKSGLFRGPIDDGELLEITFTCDSPQAAVPLDRTRKFTDIAALLTKDGHERIVSTAVQEGCGEDGRVSLSNDDDNAAERGALTGAQISPQELKLWIGGSELTFDTFSVASEDNRAGTFRGTTADGISVVGAYSCRE